MVNIFNNENFIFSWKYSLPLQPAKRMYSYGMQKSVQIVTTTKLVFPIAYLKRSDCHGPDIHIVGSKHASGCQSVDKSDHRYELVRAWDCGHVTFLYRFQNLKRTTISFKNSTRSADFNVGGSMKSWWITQSCCVAATYLKVLLNLYNLPYQEHVQFLFTLVKQLLVLVCICRSTDMLASSSSPFRL